MPKTSNPQLFNLIRMWGFRIISKNKNGKEQWENLDKIWLKVRNEKEFKKYITGEIKKFKEGK